MSPHSTLYRLARILLFVVITSLIACGPATITTPAIRIGLIAPLSGSLAEVGQAGVAAAELFVAEVNAAGGLQVGSQRYPLQLVTVNDLGTSEHAVSAARQLINQEDVVAVVGPYTSNNAIAVADVAEESHIPFISPWATNPDVTAGRTYMFRAGFTDTLQGQVIARFGYETLGARTAAVLYDAASAYNRGLAGYFRMEFEAYGGHITDFEDYTTNEQDFSRQLATIREHNPDVLFLPNYHHEIPLQVHQIREHGIDATLLGSDTWSLIEPQARTELDGTFFTAHYVYDNSNVQQQAFIARYRSTYDRPPNDIDALTYDALGVLTTAMQQQANTTPEAIQTGLSQLPPYNGITGTISYTGTGDPVKSVAIAQFQAGQVVFHQTVTSRFR